VLDLATTAIDSDVPTSTAEIQVNFDLLIDLLKKAQSQPSEMSKLSDESLHLLMSTTETVSELAYLLIKVKEEQLLKEERKVRLDTVIADENSAI